MLFSTIGLVLLLPTALGSSHRQWARQIRRPEPDTPQPGTAMINAPQPSADMLREPDPGAVRPGSPKPVEEKPERPGLGSPRHGSPRPGTKSQYLNAKSQSLCDPNEYQLII